ncbi:MAG: DUF3108 domain-containing protein [Pseudomonadota bacterium]
MRRAGVAGLVAAALMGGIAGASPEERLSAVFDIYLGGLKIAEMAVNAEFAPETYRADAVLETKGVVGAFYRASFEAQSEGAVAGEALAPARFAANSRDSRKSQYVEMRYQGGAPSALTAEPAFVPKPWEVEPTEQRAADPLSAAIGALVKQPAGGLCARDVEIYDGRRRYKIVLGTPEAREGGIYCPALYRRVAGFKPKMMAKPDYPFGFWFSEMADGSFQILRAMGETPIGTAVIKRR